MATAFGGTFAIVTTPASTSVQFVDSDTANLQFITDTQFSFVAVGSP